jgi:CRISPR-associated protein Csb3
MAGDAAKSSGSTGIAQERSREEGLMSHAVVPVDLMNPGQVFACLGLLEASRVLLGSASGGFDWNDERNPHFHVCSEDDRNPIAAVLEFLQHAQVRSLASDGSSLKTEAWSIPTQSLPTGCGFPFPEPSSPATLPASLQHGSSSLVIDHWGDATGRDNVKFWAGAGGYPGVGLVRDALDLIRDRLPNAVADPFGICVAQTSSFRFDWRRDYTALGAGFSLNRHSKISPRGYPLVEILAAIGLSHARPLRPERRNKLLYKYAVLSGERLPLSLLRAGLGCSPLPLPRRVFRFRMDWPGKEGQARCITDVTEET